MYIDTAWAYIALILAIYLFWKIYRLKSTTTTIWNCFNAYVDKSEGMQKSLCNIIIYQDAVSLKKASETTKKKFLKEQANDLRTTFENNTLKEFPINGKIEACDDPIDLLSKALDMPIEKFIDYRDQNEEIASSLRIRVDDIEL